MEKFYIAHALVFNDDNQQVAEVFCGLYRERAHAYSGVKKIIGSSGIDMKYVPKVRVAEVLDDVNGDNLT